MDTRQLKPKLRKFLSQFDDCFLRKDTRSHLPTNVEGQLSSLQDKSVAPIALKAGVAPRTLQEFLSQLKWDQDKLRDRLQDCSWRECDRTWGKKKSGGDGVPGPDGPWGVDPLLVAGPTTRGQATGADGRGDPTEPAQKRRGTTEPHQENARTTPRVRNQADRNPPMPLGSNLAL